MVQMKVIIFVFLFAFTRGDIQDFIGEWTPVLTFFDPPKRTMCDRFRIAREPSTCVCNGTSVPVTTREVEKTAFEIAYIHFKFPTIIVTSPDEVLSALLKVCLCKGEKRYHVVFRRLNDNCFVAYEIQNGKKYTESAPYDASLMVKNVPSSLQELEDSCKIEDLKHESRYLVCPSMFP